MQNNCHLSILVHEQAKVYGDREALVYKDFGGSLWKSLSWKEFSRRVSEMSAALLTIGVKPQDMIAIFSQNSLSYMITDFGAWGVRAVTIPLYATSSEQQIQYIMEDAQVKILFVGEQTQYDKAHRVFSMCPSLQRIIIYDRSVRISTHDPHSLYFDDFIKMGDADACQAELDRLKDEARMDDIANILYTSGTTGDSKGVILLYSMYHAAFAANARHVPVGEHDRVIDFLPFTHIFEKAWALYSLSQGATLIINTYPHQILESLLETHPTCMSAVPRFWEKVYSAVIEEMDHANTARKHIMLRALKIGRSYVEYTSRGLQPPVSLKMSYNTVNRTLFSIVRKRLGLENAHFFPTAGAAVNPYVEKFAHSIGLNMMVGYGLTESLATVSCDHFDKPYTIGSVGRPLEILQLKFSAEGEILLKGPTITPGYYRREALTKAAFDEEGFFHTGDAGYMKDGELFLTERLKDLFKTSNGKYIAPQMIEAKLLVDKYIDQIAVIADKKKFVSALIIPEYRLLEDYARKNHIPFSSREDLCVNKQIYDMMADRIDTLQQSLAGYEQIKRFTLLPHHFSTEKGELTDTLKLKRRVLHDNYRKEIEKMYEE